MFVVTGKDFDLLRQKAILYGAKDLKYSTKKNKKYIVYLKNGKSIHFGDSRYEDFLIHKNPFRRKKYRLRASKIKDKYGNLTYKDKKITKFLEL